MWVNGRWVPQTAEEARIAIITLFDELMKAVSTKTLNSPTYDRLKKSLEVIDLANLAKPELEKLREKFFFAEVELYNAHLLSETMKDKLDKQIMGADGYQRFVAQVESGLPKCMRSTHHHTEFGACRDEY